MVIGDWPGIRFTRLGAAQGASDALRFRDGVDTVYGRQPASFLYAARPMNLRRTGFCSVARARNEPESRSRKDNCHR